MSINTENYHLSTELILKNNTKLALTVPVINLTLIKLEKEVVECHLTLLVNLELYQRIDIEELFNLRKEARNPVLSGNFQSDFDIKIEIGLQPNLLPTEIEQAANAMEAATYILNLNQEQPEHPIFYTENWLALSVKQTHDTGEIGYQTIWANIIPSAFAQAASSPQSEEISQIISKFTQDLTNGSYSGISEENITQTLAQMTNAFSEATEDISEMTGKMLSEAIEELNDVFENLAQEISEITEEVDINKSIFTTIVNFFTQENWQFTVVAEQSTLYINIQGNNGQWNCYAKAREAQQQFIFYSICPIKTPESKLAKIAEFIARANYDVIIGNFELDFRDGEIRYKTSIDVEDDNLSFICCKNLVYTNITMMDKYLPGIISVINSNISPELAINKVEQNQEISQSPAENEQVSMVIPVDEQKELASQPSYQTELKPQEIILNREPHILAKLTPNEIGEFHQALQIMQPYQRKQTQVITDKLQKSIVARLGNLGADVFNQAVNFFIKNKFPGKNLKLIQRYSGIAGRAKLLLQKLEIWVKQYGEPADNSDVSLAIKDLETLFGRADKRLAELPTDKLLGEKELKLLIEIEKFREELSFYERLVSNFDESRDRGFTAN
jgi:hypothetical protein